MLEATQLDTLADYLENLGLLSWRQAETLHQTVRTSGLGMSEQWDIILEQFPEIITAFQEQSMVVTAEWWANNSGGLPELVIPETTSNPAAVRDALCLSMAGVAHEYYDDLFLTLAKAWAYRSVFESERTMVADYIAEHGMRYARHAQPGACAFCRFMAVRGGVYHPEPLHEKSAEETDYLRALEGLSGKDRYDFLKEHPAPAKRNKHLGRLNQNYAKFHDHCRCMVVPAAVYADPPYLRSWKKDFDKVYTGDLKTTLANMRAVDPDLHH